MPPVTPAPTPVLGLIALWSDRHPSEFPSAAPPCDALGDPSADRVLAAVFKATALDPDPVHQLVHLSDMVKLHTNRVNGALLAKPERYAELRTWLRMILVLSSWFMALHPSFVSGGPA